MNKVPKLWYEQEIYCQLIPNEDDKNPYYDILPRLGAFEVSTVQEGQGILFYSKQMSSMWPNAKALTRRISAYVEDQASMKGVELKSKYYTTGMQYK